MGCRVLGDVDSPVIPIMLYHPEKIYNFSQACLRRNLAVVVLQERPSVVKIGAATRQLAAARRFASRAAPATLAATHNEEMKNALSSQLTQLLENHREEMMVFRTCQLG